ncbi:hypothetical protein ES332_A09G113600v1 [Gossypium tomentosum]|uniref:Uncharacterized protein n=1 Tax=Gossypium tomentosum TaxID=34277 RepID=A0A5D2P138_GOSTO|nr:hypothetical protein ES332_A09G113600v1 [Gossypium tomentosum]
MNTLTIYLVGCNAKPLQLNSVVSSLFHCLVGCNGLLQPYSIQPYSRQNCRLQFSTPPTEYQFSVKIFQLYPSNFFLTTEHFLLFFFSRLIPISFNLLPLFHV